jgi:hypothetical protein
MTLNFSAKITFQPGSQLRRNGSNYGIEVKRTADGIEIYNQASEHILTIPLPHCEEFEEALRALSIVRKVHRT